MTWEPLILRLFKEEPARLKLPDMYENRRDTFDRLLPHFTNTLKIVKEKKKMGQEGGELDQAGNWEHAQEECKPDIVEKMIITIKEGKEEGITFSPEHLFGQSAPSPPNVRNSIDAFLLLKYAAAKDKDGALGLENNVADAIFKAHYCDNRLLTKDTLLHIAENEFGI